MLSSLQGFFSEYGAMLTTETGRTLIMTIVPTFIGYLLGLPLGVLLFITRPQSLCPAPRFNLIIGWLVNMGRSIPFIILLVTLMPFARVIVGTSVGTLGVLPALAISAFPFVSRMVEQSIEEVHPGMIEASQAYGATVWQTVRQVIIPESLPSIIRGLSITMIAIVGYSAIAGAIGAGGLGDFAIRYGYYRGESALMIPTIIILIIIIQIIQTTCDILARKVDKRIRAK